MSERTFKLVVGITTGVATIGAAVVAFFNPPYEPAIVASITIAEGAVISICSNFKEQK